MKPGKSLKALPAVVLALSLQLLQGCGGGGDSSENVVNNPAPPPDDGIVGSVASKISGAQLSVQDADGEDIVLASGRTTDSNGNYSLVFSEFAIDSGIKAPLVVTMDASGATAICDFDREGNNDCQNNEGGFVSFGETYTLPDGFTLRGVTATFPQTRVGSEPRTVTVNLSAASDLATAYALKSSVLDEASVTLASNQALGVVEFVTGLSTNGLALNEITASDLTAADATDTPGLAVALFGAGLHGLVNVEVSNFNRYRKVLNRVAEQFRTVVDNPLDQLRVTGSFLAEVISGYVATATSFQASLAQPSAVLAGSIAAQTVALPRLQQIAGGPVFISQPSDPASSAPLDQGKIFASRLSEAMGATLLISESLSFAGTPAGAATVYEEQLSLISTLVSSELRQTILQLDEAIAEAQATNTTELTGTNVSGVLAFDGDTITMTTTNSTSSNIQTGISVNLNITQGTRNNANGDGTFNASDITISITQTVNDQTTQELFDGSLVVELASDGSSVDATSISYEGSLRSFNIRTFDGSISLTNPQPVSEQAEAGNYDATFTFADGSTLAMNGLVETAVSVYTINAGQSTIVTDIETGTVTDMTTDLNLVIQGDAVTSGVLTSGGTQTGTLDGNGVLSFTDDTAIALPAPII